MSAVYKTQEGRGSFVRMDFNEGPPPPPALLAMDLAEALAIYPEYGKLKAAAAAAWGVDPGCLVPVNGADEGIFLLLRLLGGGGLVFPVPGFPMYRVYADQLEVAVAEVPLDAAYDLDVDAVLAAPGGVVAVTSPNNPTGRAVPGKDLLRILDQGRTVILDETYGPFCGQDFAPLMTRYPNLVLLRTLSKAHGVPGLRCGFVLARPELAARLDGLRSPFNVNAAAVALGTRLLAQDPGFRDRVAAALAAREGLQGRLDEAGIRTVPSDAHFFMADLGPGAVERLRGRGILVKDLSALAPGLARISVASETEARIFENAYLGGRP
jgi:histidinol-phosphate aminotransferase